MHRVRGKYRREWEDITFERNVQKMDVTSKGSYRGQKQDGDHTDGYYITMFAEQLTRTFEVLVIIYHREFDKSIFTLYHIFL